MEDLRFEIETAQEIVEYFIKNKILNDEKVVKKWELAIAIRANAIQSERNRILSEALMTGLSTPGALEAIAMELGAGSALEPSIKKALYEIGYNTSKDDE